MNIELKTAAAYIRVSTDNQTELSPDSQIKEIRKYAKQHGYIVPNEFIFRDDGISGRKAEKRPDFIRMIAIAKQKPAPFSAVLLWKFSRFARNQEESIFYKGMLAKNNIDVKSISEPIIDGPFGSLIERIIEWFDEFYSINLSGEVKRGMTERVERGGAVSIPAFGYNIVDKKYVINPDTAPIVRQIYADYLNGMGALQIAHKINDMGIRTTRGNLWENRTIDYILHNPVYIGKIRWNPNGRTRRNYDDPNIMIVDGQHEPIIDEDSFNKVQAMYEVNQKKHARYAHTTGKKYMYMLHGLVKCSDCGSSLSMSARGQGLQCIRYTKGQCKSSHYISIKRLNEMVISTIDTFFQSGMFNVVVKDTQSTSPAVEIDVDALIEKEVQKYDRIKEAFEAGIYTVEELRKSRDLIDQRINALRAQKKPQPDVKALRRKIINENKNAIQTLRDPSVSEEEKNALLHGFVDRIIFDRANTSIDVIFYI
ncbi:recombinase family protein [Ruminococcus sp.]|uniref:recombinase family protein n=1 Tax=Ruminococcus sp. TaxID=41978 RepID=UPI003864174F